jgi:hypothetical protein
MSWLKPRPTKMGGAWRVFLGVGGEGGARELQRLKPCVGLGCDVAAEATTHEDERRLKPCVGLGRDVVAQATTHKDERRLKAFVGVGCDVVAEATTYRDEFTSCVGRGLAIGAALARRLDWLRVGKKVVVVAGRDRGLQFARSGVSSSGDDSQLDALEFTMKTLKLLRGCCDGD